MRFRVRTRPLYVTITNRISRTTTTAMMMTATMGLLDWDASKRRRDAAACRVRALSPVSAGADRLLVDLDVALGQAVQREVGDAGRARVHEPVAQIVRIQEPAEPGPQRVGVVGRDEPCVLVVTGHVAVARDVRREHARARGHRLEQHDAEGLLTGGRGAEDRRAGEVGQLLLLGDPAEP